MRECFGDVIPFDKVERGDRLLEETFELLQSGDYDPARVLALRDYVWNRPVGDPAQEVGGVMVTLAAYCLAFGLDMHAAGETELSRVWTKVDVIRAKQAAKPTGSALPIASPTPEHGGREGWRPIETAPRDGTSIVLADTRPHRDHEAFVGRWDPGIFGLLSGWDDGSRRWPTHWMPLPEPPVASRAAESSPPSSERASSRDEPETPNPEPSA